MTKQQQEQNNEQPGPCYQGRSRDLAGTLLFFQKTQTLQSRGVVTLFHLFTIAIYVENCFDMQH